MNDNLVSVKNVSVEDTIRNILGIILLICVTFGIDSLVYKYFKK